MTITRRLLLAGTAAGFVPYRAMAEAPVLAGVSGPLSGPNAQYGAQWKKGFDLALEQINQTPYQGRTFAYTFEDSQSDPRQSVTVAQKFVSDPRIIIELGDFSSPASMAASPIYQRAKLVQFGFTNSHPDFTKGGDYMWSNSASQADEQPKTAEYAISALGLQRLAVLHLNTDWGRTSKDAFVKAATGFGAQVVDVEGYLPTEQDFRSMLVRARDAKPDGLVLLSYYADAALLVRQIRDLGLPQVIVAASSVYSPKLIELGGPAANGVHTISAFFPAEKRPEVLDFVTRFRAKYDVDPDMFNAGAYDTMNLFAALVRQFGATRPAMHDGLEKIKDVPSVVYGHVTFNTETHRAQAANYKYLVVKDGAFAMWDGVKPARPVL
ncbi:MAG TPA: ABC transporter substrate-binding protein [Acetobacteraceae bacterium]|nr:ABC transporter substrate-binding protein [Acetobacteraceae bacterium]